MDERIRIIELMELHGLSASQFANRTGIQRASVSHIVNGRNNPSLEVMLKIYQTFPDVDLKWLMTGEGEAPVSKNEYIDDTHSSSSNILNELPLFSDSEDKLPDTTSYQYSKQEKVESCEAVAAISTAVNKSIKEIKIFYNNGTYETFKPEKE